MRRKSTIALAALSLFGFIGASCADDSAQPFNSTTYADQSSRIGVVLVSANWGRKWKCGRFENAQLRSLSFDKAGQQKSGNEAPPDLLVEDSSLLPAPSSFVNYAFLVEPGEYVLSGYNIKVSQSITKSGSYTARRTAHAPGLVG